MSRRCIRSLMVHASPVPTYSCLNQEIDRNLQIFVLSIKIVDQVELPVKTFAMLCFLKYKIDKKFLNS